MKPRYSFSSKHTRKARNSPKMRKQKGKYPILIKQIIEQSDIILEVLDARFIKETQNTELEEKINAQKKKLLYVLNKSDLIRNKTKQNLQNYIYVSCKNRTGIKELRNKIKFLSRKTKQERTTIGIIGYPNTGKSSLINLLIGKSKAGTGADAGFTKGIQKLKLTNEIMLLDTPGVIPEKEYSSIEQDKIARHTIVGGRSYSQVKDPEMVIAELMHSYKDVLEKHYKIKGDSEKLLEHLGRKWKFLKKGRQVNFDKTARRILKEWQDGIIKI